MKRLFSPGLIGIILISITLSAKPQVNEVKIVDLEGAGYELGLQHGKKLKIEIDDLVKKWRAFVIRGILTRKEKPEVLSFVNSLKHASGQNYLLGIKGEVIDLEASANKVVRFDPQNENGAVYHTNHPIVNDDLKDWHAEWIIKLQEEGGLENTNSYLRLNALVSRVSGSVQVDDELLKEALRSKDDENNPVCSPLLPNRSGFTFASIIMTHSGEPYIQVTAGPPDESEYVRFDFSK